LVSHTHVLTEKSGFCIICRTSTEVIEATQARKEATIPGLSTLMFTMETLQNKEQEETVSRKRFRGTQTKWKCSMCLQLIYKGLKRGISCWDLAHRQIAR
jgi:hypothetical protein